MASFLIRSLAIAGLCLASLPAFAQEAEKPFRLQAAVGAPDWLKLSGSIRPRYETLANQFFAGRTGDDEYLGVQSLLKLEADTGAIILGGEIQDTRRLIGNEGGGTPAEVDALEPIQLYVAWRPKDFLMDGASFDLMAGRFSMDIGGRRLVARAGFRNVLASFDGVRGVWTTSQGVKLTGFYTAPVNRAPTDVESALDNDVELNKTAEETRFAGIAFEAKLPIDAVGEIYLFDLDEDDASDVPTRNRDLSTFGVRLKRAPKAATFDFDLEYVRQTGSVRATANPADLTDLDHDADMAHLEAGYTFDTAWAPRVSFHYDFASGDNSPADLDSERFDPLFGDRSFEFGPTSIWGAIFRSNLDSPGVRLELKPNKTNELMSMVRQVKLDSPTDIFGNSGVRDATGASGDNVGTQVELRWRHQVIPDSIRLTFGAAAFIRDDFLKTAPNATLEGDSYFGYTELLFQF
ncbi:MAG: alginate export family protein [Hyphomonadaceae bacterium]|nr:alginate export family protein [Hyphomonadaceae bacterium]